MNNEKIYDVIIIGGGINGLGIALEMGLRNIKTLVLEKNDIASGTSSASSKLVHGGLRYLKQGYLDLVFESLKEQKLLLKNARHLVKPLPFIFPIYKNTSTPKFILKLGFWLYDFLKPKNSTPKHQFLNTEQTLNAYPNLKRENLEGSFIYYDAVMNDARICIELAEMAKEYNVDIKTYHKVTKIYARNEQKIECIDEETQQKKEFYGKLIVNCTGPWTDETLALSDSTAEKVLKPNKGIHIITTRINQNYALAIQKKSKQITFVIPWENKSIIGTTETHFENKIDTQKVEEIEINILKMSIKKHINIETIPIIASYSGIRPLVKDRKKSLTTTSRKEKIFFKDNILNIVGGKYTTYRAIAEKASKHIFKIMKPSEKFYSKTEVITFDRCKDLNINQKKIKEIKQFLKQNSKLDMELLFSRYGNNIEKFYQILLEDKHNIKEIGETTYTKADIIYMIRFEYAKTISDIVKRRSPLFFQGKANKGVVLKINSILQIEKSWDDCKSNDELKKYYNNYL